MIFKFYYISKYRVYVKVKTMVLGVPLAKAAPLFLKVMTKPIVDGLKRNAQRNPQSFWNSCIILPLARYYNKQSLRFRLYSQGLHRNKQQLEESAKMNDEAALQLGAEIVANTATIVIGLVAIIMQNYLSAQAEYKKKVDRKYEEEEKDEEIRRLGEKVVDLDFAVEHLNTQLRSLNRTVLMMKAYNEVSKEASLVEDNNDSNS